MKSIADQKYEALASYPTAASPARRIPIEPGRRYRLIMPHSEVCIHMRMADQLVGVVLESRYVPTAGGGGRWAESVRVVRRHFDRDWIGPTVTPGEAGIYTVHGEGGRPEYYTYIHPGVGEGEVVPPPAVTPHVDPFTGRRASAAPVRL